MDFLTVNLRNLKIQLKRRFLWIFPPWVALGLFHSVCSERFLNPSGV